MEPENEVTPNVETWGDLASTKPQQIIEDPLTYAYGNKLRSIHFPTSLA